MKFVASLLYPRIVAAFVKACKSCISVPVGVTPIGDEITGIQSPRPYSKSPVALFT